MSNRNALNLAFLNGLNVGVTWYSVVVTFHDTVIASSFEKETQSCTKKCYLNISTSPSFEGGSFLLWGCWQRPTGILSQRILHQGGTVLPHWPRMRCLLEFRMACFHYAPRSSRRNKQIANTFLIIEFPSSQTAFGVTSYGIIQFDYHSLKVIWIRSV